MATNSGKTESTTTGGAAASSNPTLSQLTDEFSNTLTSADTSAAQGIQVLQQVHQARLSLLTRTAASLKAQYGAEDPRVKAAQTAVTATTETVGRIALVSQQLSAPVPQVPTNGWVLHGHVVDAEQATPKPLAKYTVFLVESQNTYQEAYGFTYTDEMGYFQLSYEGTESKTPSRAAPELFVQVANTKGLPVYLDDKAFQPTVGSATYRKVLSGTQPIGDPPDAIRNIAIPSQKKPSKARQKKSP
jgi:hypothetical protein